VLVEQFAGAMSVLLVDGALGFGTAESRPIGFGLLRRLMPLGTFLKPLQIDDIPHVCLRHATDWSRATLSRVMREMSRCAGSVVISNSPRCAVLYHVPAQPQ
jgi:hypothetical protein